MTVAVGAIVLSAALVAQATGGRITAGSADRVFSGTSTDTRALLEGSLFIALHGDRFDGHAFLDAAIAGGAAGLLVSTAPAAPQHAAVIQVPDTLIALQQLGRAVRRASKAKVIAITGSAGKTTTKEVTAELLSRRYRVFRNRGNLNNHIGLPLSLIELHRGQDVAVVELGMNHAGEISTLVRIAEPDVRVWLNVGDAHIGHFGSREAVAEAKAELVEGATDSTVIVANADDTLVMRHVQQAAGKLVTFGTDAAADVRAISVIDHGFDGTEADVRTPAGSLHLKVGLSGRAQLSNVLASVAVALECGVAPADIEDAVAACTPVARRGAVTRLPDGTRIVDDSYNASPAAVQAMLTALAATPADGRRVAVLGEMRELGDASVTLHHECGLAAARAGVALLVAVGGEGARALAGGAIEGGMDRAAVHSFADSTEAAAHIARLVRPRDLVLVKGSRGTRTDIVSDRLLGVA